MCLALSTVDDTGSRRGIKLCKLHTLKNPQEYYRVVMAHKSAEGEVVDVNDKILGWLGMSHGEDWIPSHPLSCAD